MLAVVIAHLAAVSPVRTTVPRAAVRMNLFSSILGNAMPTIDYSTLAGRPSWGKEAGENALAGVIPTESSDGFKVATFAGGCFWGIELAYQRVPGVVATAVGYAQGQLQKPTYAAVCSATTGHTEAVQLLYDPKEVTYEQLCGVLMSRLGRSMFLKDQVGNDRGPQVCPPLARAGRPVHAQQWLTCAVRPLPSCARARSIATASTRTRPSSARRRRP